MFFYLPYLLSIVFRGSVAAPLSIRRVAVTKYIYLIFTKYIFLIFYIAQVVGGGPAGLSLVSSIVSIAPSVQEIVLYERKQDVFQTNLGGGVQLTGGAVVLEKLGMFKELKKNAEQLNGVEARDNNGNNIFSLDISQSIKGSEKASNILISKSYGDFLSFSIMRDNLQKLLYNFIIENGGSKVVVKTGVEVLSYSENIENGEITVKLENGNIEAG